MTGILAATAQGLCLSLEHETRVPAGESLRSHGKRRTSSSLAGGTAVGDGPHHRCPAGKAGGGPRAHEGGAHGRGGGHGRHGSPEVGPAGPCPPPATRP